MKKSYFSEIEGMVDFYQELQITPSYDLNTDGVINGTLFEFKKTKSNDGGVYKHKEQIKRYLKAYNSAAKNIPSITYLIYLNSSEYIKIDNESGLEIDSGEWHTASQFKKEVESNKKYLKGYIDEYSIVSYNNRFCLEYPSANKEDIKSEFTNPKFLNIEPFDWEKRIQEENENQIDIGWLHFNMNQLGNALLKKQLGAFFTPEEYVKKSTKYLRNAINRSKELGFSDYLIIDRCAGTGNLERFLRNDELEHCILNTLDYTEWTTLKGLYDGRVKMIIPPTHELRDGDGLLKNGNALSEEFNDYLLNFMKGIDRKTTYIIFLENPPFRDETSTLTSVDKKSKKSINYISKLMNNDAKIKGAMKNELSLKFIWSAWQLYNPNEYILFSPIKYWKIYHMFQKKFYDGYITNRKNYNANFDAGLPVINWSSENVNFQDVLQLENGEIKKINHSIKILLDKSKNSDFFAKLFIMAGDLRPIGTSLDNGAQIIHDNPCLINEENILKQLPLWVAAKYEPKNLELNILMKSGDGGKKYLKDNKFLKDCLIWSCLTNKNKCISNNKTINEMALLQKSKTDKILSSFNLDQDDKKLLERWEKVLSLSSKCDEFNKNYKYGLHQLEKELNIKEWKGNLNKKQEHILEYKYIELNDQIKYLKSELKDYYLKNLQPLIFKYELVK